MHFVNAAGETLMVRRGTDGPGRHGWANNWYFHQPDLDAALRTGAARFENVEVRLRHEARALRDAGDHVSVGIRSVATGASDALTARYVVGCDGARSLVRDAIGASMLDLGLHQPWLVVDVVASSRSERAKRLPDYTVQHCDPRRPMTRVHVKGLRHRFEIMLMPGDDEGEIVRPERIWPMLAPHGIGPDDVRIERSAIYTFHSLVAAPWRCGRLLLAGDSAHQTPPFLGQGMCAGIRDASNLAWKLSMVVAGAAGESLLDTCETERAPHVRAFIELAVRLGAVIQATDPAVAEARDAEFRASGPKMFDFPQPRLGPGIWTGGRAGVRGCVPSAAAPRRPPPRRGWWATGSRCSPPFRSTRGPARAGGGGAGAASTSPSSMPRDRPSRSGWPRAKRWQSSFAPTATCSRSSGTRPTSGARSKRSPRAFASPHRFTDFLASGRRSPASR